MNTEAQRRLHTLVWFRRHPPRYHLRRAKTIMIFNTGKPMRKQTHTQTLPQQQFQGLFTPFSRDFSPFLHSTCSLSVSHQYLVLDGIYHQIRVVISNNSTLILRRSSTQQPQYRQDFNPLWWYCSVYLIEVDAQGYAVCQHHNLSRETRHNSDWTIPSSFAITRGILVSFFSSA